MPILDQIIILLGFIIASTIAVLTERINWRDHAETNKKRGKLFYTKGKLYKIIETDVIRVKTHSWFQLPDENATLRWHVVIDTPKQFKGRDRLIAGKTIKPKDSDVCFKVDDYYFINTKQLVVKVERVTDETR